VDSAKDTLLAMDFGTSNSLVGMVSPNQQLATLPLDPSAKDNSIMRSLVYFPNENKAYFGVEAITEYIQNDFEGRLFRSFKSHLPNPSYLGTLIGKNRRLPLEELVGLFLLQMKKRAETSLLTDVSSVVLGRPARYSMDPIEDELALHRMKKAAEFAGFKNVHFVPEPLAAAFNYRKNQSQERIVLIGDFGGGTSDFTIIRIGPFDFKKSDVLAIEGCPLAGDALDSLFMSQHLNRHFGATVKYKMPMSSNLHSMPPLILDRLNKPAHMVHLKEPATYEFIREIMKVAVRNDDKDAIDRLLCLVDDNQIFSFFEEIEKTKRGLSSELTADFKYNYPGIDIKESLTRQQFEAWAQEFRTKVFAALDRTLVNANLTEDSIDLICLTGGTAFVPMIHDELARRFGNSKLDSSSHFHSVQSGLIEAANLIRQGVDVAT
jgi:hypothetical chaperone protein